MSLKDRVSACHCDFCASCATLTADGRVKTPYYLLFSPPTSTPLRCAYVIKIAAVFNEGSRVAMILPSGKTCGDITAATRQAMSSTGCYTTSENIYDDWFLHIGGKLQPSSNYLPAMTRRRNLQSQTHWSSFVQCTRFASKQVGAKRSAPTARSNDRRIKPCTAGEDGAPAWWERKPNGMSYGATASLKRTQMAATPPSMWTAEFIDNTLLADPVAPPELLAVEMAPASDSSFVMCSCTFLHPDGTPITAEIPLMTIRFIPEYASIVAALKEPTCRSH